jgi:AcrR family transcriptional regulator
VPPLNLDRRRAIADAAIQLIAAVGLRGLTHRAIDQHAELPPGTTANYYSTRDALLVAAAERIAELHRADMESAEDAHRATSGGPVIGTAQDVVDLLTHSLLLAATTHRSRYLAIFELQTEARRRPPLQAAMEGLVRSSVGFSAAHHQSLQLPIPPAAVPGLVSLYGGALYGLVSLPEEKVTEAAARSLAEAMTYGAVRDRDPD